MNNNVVIFLTIFLPVFVVVVVLASRKNRDSRLRGNDRCVLVKPKKKSRSEVKKDNKQKVLDLLKTKKKITNGQVEKLLGVSDSTATRYLDELEKKEEVRQVGKTGKHTHYIKK